MHLDCSSLHSIVLLADLNIPPRSIFGLGSVWGEEQVCVSLMASWMLPCTWRSSGVHFCHFFEMSILMGTGLCRITIQTIPHDWLHNFWRKPHKLVKDSSRNNPIENMWHELKEFLRREVKPQTKDELIRGIHQFWDAVIIEKCSRYIRHLTQSYCRARQCYQLLRFTSHFFFFFFKPVLFRTTTFPKCYTS